MEHAITLRDMAPFNVRDMVPFNLRNMVPFNLRDMVPFNLRDMVPFNLNLLAMDRTWTPARLDLQRALYGLGIETFTCRGFALPPAAEH